jgi:rhamnosyltransferase
VDQTGEWALSAPSTARTETQTAAVIVAFAPDESQLNRLIGVLSRECKAVYVMDNGGGRDAITAAPQTDAAMQIVDMGGNRGLGEALNQGFRLAAADGFAYVATFDQDSEPAAGQIAALVREFKALASRGSKVAAVGPRTVDERGTTRLEHSFTRRIMGWPAAARCVDEAKYVETDYLMTSGSVISMSAYLGVGQFDADLFVDYTDMEWCFRAAALGYRFFGICSVIMPHELSNGISARALGITVLGYSPIRRYYYARNVVLLLRRAHVAAGWKAKLLIGLVARVLLLPAAVGFSAGWTRHWPMLVRGIRDGIMGIRGPYPGAH